MAALIDFPPQSSAGVLADGALRYAMKIALHHKWRADPARRDWPRLNRQQHTRM